MLWFIAGAIVVLSVVETVGDSIIKQAGNNPEKYMLVGWFVLGVCVYMLAATGWFFVFKHVKLGSIGMIYGLTTVISLVVMGIVFFDETYTKTEIFGLLLGFTALLLLARTL